MIVGAVVAASVASPWVLQYSQRAKARDRDEILRRQAGRVTQLSAENQDLSNRLAQARSSALAHDQLRELLRLRGEIGPLRDAASEAARLRVENRPPPTARTGPDEPSPTPAAPDPRTVRAYWPKTQLNFAGYADPQSALKTALWAMTRDDPEALAASVTPEAKSALAREKWFDHGPPAEEIAAATKKIADSVNPSSGFYVVGQDLVSPEQSVLEVYFEGEGTTRKFALLKIGEEWKFDHLGDGSWP